MVGPTASSQERSKTAQMASRRLKMPPRRPKMPSRDLPRGPQEAKISDFPLVFGGFGRSRLFGLPALQDGPKSPQDRPKSAQEASKMAP